MPATLFAAPGETVPREAAGVVPWLLLLGGVVALNLLFTMAQMAVAAIGPNAIGEIEKRKSILARHLRRFIGRLPILEEQFSVSSLVMMLLMILLCVRIGFVLMPESLAVPAILGAVGAFLLQLVIVEVLARNLTLRNPGKVFSVLVPPVALISSPMLLFVIPARVFRVFPGEQENIASVSAMHLRILPSLSGVERVLDEDAFELIDSVRDFADATAEDVMTPRTEVEAIADSLSSSEVYETVRKSEYSRIVVYHETIDNVVGTLLAKEVLLQRPRDPWTLLRKPLIVSESTRLPELLRMIRANRTHLVVVMDEYGGMAGVVTLHDLFEMIVGHIEDIEDQEELWIQAMEEGQYRLNGRVEIWEVNDELNLDLDEDTARTIGGLVFNTLGRVPQAEDVLEIGGVSIRVEEVADNRVETVILEIPKPEYVPPGEDG